MRHLFLSLLLLVVPSICKGQFIHVIYPKGNTSGVFENDSIVAAFEYDNSSFIRFSLYNKMNERIYIEWNNFRINNSAIVFDDDRRITMNQKKEDEAIASESNSQSRSLTLKDFVGDSYIGSFSKGIPYKVIIPIKFENKSIDYKVKFEILNSLSIKPYPTKEDIDKIYVGMGDKELKSLLNSSYTATGGVNEPYIYIYRNGLKIHLERSQEAKKIRKVKGNFVVVSIDKSEIIDGDIEALKF